MGSIGKCCCDCEGCPLIPFEDLPVLTIPDHTAAGAWEKVGCCWKQTFSPNSDAIVFTDGGALQIDGSTTVESRNLKLLKSSRPSSYFPIPVVQSDSGGPYTPYTNGPAAWRTYEPGTPDWVYGPNPYQNGSRPPCPTCVGPVDCLTWTATNFQEGMERWGLRTRKAGIVVYLQKVRVTCGSETEPTCQYVLTSSQKVEYQPVFSYFYRGEYSQDWTGFGCCVAPVDTSVVTPYPDFNNSALYYPVDFVAPDGSSILPFFRVVSSVRLTDLTPQDVGFGYGICADCVEDVGASFCDECAGDDGCFSSTGSGIPGVDCTPKIVNHVVCTGSWAVGCRDYFIHEWDDGVKVCLPMALPYVDDCPLFSYDIYSFSAIACPSTPPRMGTIIFAPPPAFSLGLATFDLSACDPVGTGTCPVVYPVGYQPRLRGVSPTGFVGSMTGLSYSYSCSGALTQEICVATPWTVSLA